MKISDAILTTRKTAGLSQKELADFAGVGKTVIWDLEKGKKTVRMETLIKVLNVLNLELLLKLPTSEELQSLEIE